MLNHNRETVESLYPTVRPRAGYGQSLEVLRRSKVIAPDIVTKCGIMVGLGESGEQLRRLMEDVRQVGCDILTIGQYLQPSKEHLPVVHYLPPEEFVLLEQQALAVGFGAVAAAPFVRSSYQAESLYRRVTTAVGPDDN